MTRIKQIADWQRRYREQPHVWSVHLGSDETGNLYSSREAAEIEAAYWRKRRHSARVVSLGHLHTVELARERWGGGEEPGDE